MSFLGRVISEYSGLRYNPNLAHKVVVMNSVCGKLPVCALAYGRLDIDEMPSDVSELWLIRMSRMDV